MDSSETTVEIEKGFLFKRKDFLGVDQLANSHPNRTYYYRKHFDLDEVIATCSKKLQVDAANVKALFLRGSTFFKKRAYHEALSDFSNLLRREPRHVEGLYHRGMTFSKLGQQDKAIDDLSLVLSMNPEHINAAFARAACFNTIGQFSRAIEDYNFALLKDTQSPSVTSTARDEKYGDMDESSDIDSTSTSFAQPNSTQFSGVKRAPPSVPPPNFNNSNRISVLASNSDMSSQASMMSASGNNSLVTPLRQFQTRPQHSQGTSSTSAMAADEHHSRGYQLRRAGDFSGAIEEYSKAIQLDDNYFKAHFNRGFALDKLGRFEEAVMDYSRAVEIEPSNAFAHYNRGISRDRMGAIDAALVDFTKAIELQPTTADFYHNRAFCFRKLGRLQPAVEDYSQSLRLAPNHFKALFNRACCLEQLGSLEQAVADTTKALDIQPSHSGCLLNRALLYEKLNRLDQSLQDFGLALTSGADRMLVVSARSRVLSKAGRFHEAIVDLSDALSLASPTKPPDPALVFLRGMCHKSLEDFASAAADFSAVLLQDPKNVVALTQRGLCHRKLGLMDAAWRDYEEIIRIEPRNVKALNNRAFVSAKLGRFEAAVADYTIVIGLTPESSHAFHNRGISFDKLGLFDQAIADFTKVLELDSAVSPDGNNNNSTDKYSTGTKSTPNPPRSTPSPSGITRQSVSFTDAPVGVSNTLTKNTRGGLATPIRPPPAVPSETSLRLAKSGNGLFSTPQTGPGPAAPQPFKIQSGNFHAPRSAVFVPTKTAGADAAVFAHRSSPTQLVGSTDKVTSQTSSSPSNKLAPPGISPSMFIAPAADDIQVRLSRANDLLGAFSSGASSGSPLSRLAERQQRSKTPMSMHFASQGSGGLVPVAPLSSSGSAIAATVNKVPVAIGSRAVFSSSSPSSSSDPHSRAPPHGAPINAAQFLSNLKQQQEQQKQQSQSSEVPGSSLVRSPQIVSRKPLTPASSNNNSSNSSDNSLLLQEASKGRFSYK